MTDDIVTRLRVMTVAESAENIYATMIDAAYEIERLRKERMEWFLVARELRDATHLSMDRLEAAHTQYLRTRGTYEDPRDCM